MIIYEGGGPEDSRQARENQTKDASDKALAKPWNSELYLLVFIPECPKGFEPIHNLSLHPALLLTCVIQCDLFS